MPQIPPLEIHALAKIVDELDYYQILHVDKNASGADVKKAYYATSRAFHPDSNRHLENELRDCCERIAKRITEAYCVLRDPRRRRVYDDRLDEDGNPRLQLAEARAEHQRRDAGERQGKTPQGRQFFQKAMQDLQRGNAAAAVQNIRMALTFEPNNDAFKSKLEEAKAAK